MTILAFSPYGLSSEETGLIALLTSYLHQGPYSIATLSCNGVFSLCDRDGDHGWRRGLRSCFRCIKEQRSIGGWAGAPILDLSAYVHPDDVLDSKRWALSVRPSEMAEANFQGVNVFELVRGSFSYRFGVETPEAGNPQHEDAARRLMISAVRMLRASDRFLTQQQPELCLVAGAEDFITGTFAERARQKGCKTAVFRWNLNQRAVDICHPTNNRVFECPLVFEDVTSLRAEARSWPKELTRVLDEILMFLDVTASQIELPLAQ